MSCHSEYLEQTSAEFENQRAAKLLCYVYEMRGDKPGESLSAAASNIYCIGDYTGPLCKALKDMGESGREDFFRTHCLDRTCRDLMDWWEEYEEADKRRIAQEKAQAEMKKLRERAMAKLSNKEKKILGLK